ncbi:MAG: peptidoglycan D,D-transpeptidase FtsI family protein [Methylococcaceae bacterium]|jgi:cell division protein FtsI (penicillin-binding protein 3)
MLMIRPKKTEQDYGMRWRVLLGTLLASLTILIGRAVDLQVMDRQFLKHQGDLRHVGIMPVTAYRGRITDRNGELLAVSTPVKSIWVNPKEFLKSSVPQDKLKAFAGHLGLAVDEVMDRIGHDERRAFSYIKRRMAPEQADLVLGLGLPGVYAEREYRRYYPTGEVTAHLLGLTDVNDKGQEGMELAFDSSLRGIDGARRAVRDGKRRIIEKMEDIRQPVPGKDLTLSIDERLQYIANRELKDAVTRHKARSGTLAMLDAQTGEVLAMANQPAFNPNNRSKTHAEVSRNRAITDLYEPGSTMKPFAVACALELGLTHPHAVFNTNGGMMHVGSNVVKDVHSYGSMDVTKILQKSSNVGVTKIALSVPPRKFWAFYNNLGFGQPLETGYPGEARGRLSDYHGWNAFEQATLSFGYGVAASTLQLSRAYGALANDGVIPMVSLVKQDEPPQSHRIMSAKTAVAVRTMLETVVSKEGTAIQAAVPGYRVAGKTGTVKKIGAHGYSANLYNAVFAGMAPASNPRLVMVVMIDEPSAGDYYGGVVAAPVFSKVMGEALRLLNIAPDDPVTPIMAARQDDPA